MLNEKCVGTNMNPREKRKGKTRTKKKPVKEILVVDDNEDEEEGEKEKDRANLPTSLYQVFVGGQPVGSADRGGGAETVREVVLTLVDSS